MKYIVIDVDNENFDSPGLFETTTAYDAEDAVKEYLAHQESHGSFFDGYPNDWIYKTKDENGEIKIFSIDTDWEPRYWVTEKYDG